MRPYLSFYTRQRALPRLRRGCQQQLYSSEFTHCTACLPGQRQTKSSSAAEVLPRLPQTSSAAVVRRAPRGCLPTRSVITPSREARCCYLRETSAQSKSPFTIYNTAQACTSTGGAVTQAERHASPSPRWVLKGTPS